MHFGSYSLVYQLTDRLLLPYQQYVHVTGDTIRSYLQLAPGAGDQEDSEGMTPFQYLSRNDITFLEEQELFFFGAWWYHCMPGCYG